MRSKLRLNRVKMGEHCEQKYVKLNFFLLPLHEFDGWMLYRFFLSFIDFTFFSFPPCRAEGIVFVNTHKKAPYAMG